jgi:catechol 2,3-dioxygenase-like lactoylglutathione lyase family enzyme
VVAVAAAAVAAVKKAGKADQEPVASPHPQPAQEPVGSPHPQPAQEPVAPPHPQSASATAAPPRPGPEPQRRPAGSAPAPQATEEPDAAAPPAGTPAAAPAAASPVTPILSPAGSAQRSDGGPWADLVSSVEPDEHADEVITAYPTARPGRSGAIYGVGITVLVTDLDRSVAFYRDMLGFYEIDHKVDQGGGHERGDGSAVLASGDTRLVLRTVRALSAEAGRLIYINLEVGDVEAVYQDLQAKGVEFVHAPRLVNRGEHLELWSATFRDPDDHNIAVTQWRAIH